MMSGNGPFHVSTWRFQRSLRKIANCKTDLAGLICASFYLYWRERERERERERDLREISREREAISRESNLSGQQKEEGRERERREEREKKERKKEQRDKRKGGG